MNVASLTSAPLARLRGVRHHYGKTLALLVENKGRYLVIGPHLYLTLGLGAKRQQTDQH